MIHKQSSFVLVLFSFFSSSLQCITTRAVAPTALYGASLKAVDSPPKLQTFKSIDCASGWPTPSGTVTLSAPKTVTTTFDCSNKIYENKGGPVFQLSKGASLSNCFFRQTGELDTVHILGSGNFTLTNLYFQSTGDDGISIKGNANVDVIGGGFLKAGNKAIQHDGSGGVRVKGACFENVHIILKSCGNCKQNASVKGRILEAHDISIHNVRTVCGVNTNADDKCTLSGVKGTPIESLCTGYNGIINPNKLPTQTSKNVKNTHCIF